MVDVNVSVSNPDLVEAIEAYSREQSELLLQALYSSLKVAHLLVPIEGGFEKGEPNPDGSTTLKQDTRIAFPMIEDSEGNLWYAAFTDWSSLCTWRNIENEETLIFPFSDFPHMILKGDDNSAGLVINPALHNLLINKELLSYLDGIANSYYVKEGTMIQLGVPADYPHALVSAVQQLLITLPGVSQAWLLLMQIENEQSYLIVIDAQGDQLGIFRAIRRTVAQHPPVGMRVDLVSYDDEYWSRAVDHCEPFFHRET